MTRGELRERIAVDLFQKFQGFPGKSSGTFADCADYVISLMEQTREACAFWCESNPDQRGTYVAQAIRKLPLPEPK
jgi:hypothetical protein